MGIRLDDPPYPQPVSLSTALLAAQLLVLGSMLASMSESNQLSILTVSPAALPQGHFSPVSSWIHDTRCFHDDNANKPTRISAACSKWFRNSDRWLHRMLISCS
jgi:hypothetical protein